MPRTAILLLIGFSLLAQSTPEQAFEQAVRLQEQGKWSEAEAAYAAYLKRFGATPEALANLGAVQVKQARFSDAVDAYSRALRLAPEVLPIRLNLGLAYFKSGQLAPAVEQFSAVLDKQPGNSQARQLRAMSLLELERYEEAARDFSALLPTNDTGVRLGLASAYLKLGRAAEAQNMMESLFNQDSAEVKLLLGQVLIESGKLDEAKAAFQRAIELNPNLPTVHLNLGALYWRQQDTGAAIAQWRQELAAHPDSFQANYTLGAALALSSADTSEAERLLRKATAISPGNALGLYQLAKLIWQQSKAREAVSLLERSIRADATYRNSHYLLGKVYQELGRKEDAAREFAAVQRISQQEARKSQDLFESVH